MVWKCISSQADYSTETAEPPTSAGKRLRTHASVPLPWCTSKSMMATLFTPEAIRANGGWEKRRQKSLNRRQSGGWKHAS